MRKAIQVSTITNRKSSSRSHAQDELELDFEYLLLGLFCLGLCKGDLDRLRDLLLLGGDLLGGGDLRIGDLLIGDLLMGDRRIGDLLRMGDRRRYDGGDRLGKRHLPCGDILLRGDLPLRLPEGTLAGLGGRTSLQVTCCPSSHPPSMYLIASLASRPNLYST